MGVGWRVLWGLLRSFGKTCEGQCRGARSLRRVDASRGPMKSRALQAPQVCVSEGDWGEPMRLDHSLQPVPYPTPTRPGAKGCSPSGDQESWATGAAKVTSHPSPAHSANVS